MNFPQQRCRAVFFVAYVLCKFDELDKHFGLGV